MLVYQPFSRPANQDRKHFELGESTAKPAPGYFASVLGLPSERVIQGFIAGLSDEHHVEDALSYLFGSHQMACDYMYWRMRMRM